MHVAALAWWTGEPWLTDAGGLQDEQIRWHFEELIRAVKLLHLSVWPSRRPRPAA